MTSSALLVAIRAALAPRVTAALGTLELAESMDEAAAFLDAAPAKWRLILLWEGYGSHAAAREGVTTHQVTTVVQQLRGLTPVRSSKLLTFADRLEQVSAWMRGLRFPDGSGADDAGFSLSDSRWLDTIPAARAHAISFSLTAALPAFTDIIPVSL